MLIRLGYDIEFNIPQPVAVVALLNVHPSREAALGEPDQLRIEPTAGTQQYIDHFGNRCTRFLASPGKLRLWSSTLIEDSAQSDPVNYAARQHPVNELPSDALTFLMSSRYCEVDRMSNIATELFGNFVPGWVRVQAIVNWIHGKVRFGYEFARATRTALEVYTERVGVCRCMNIPARYATGYLGDIGVPASSAPMDFSAWFEVYLEGRWWTFDARHDEPRVGRVLMATGRDAADVAITTSFGTAELVSFSVVTNEVRDSAPREILRRL
jgi:transglutaminase-like putative cysteine protease